MVTNPALRCHDCILFPLLPWLSASLLVPMEADSTHSYCCCRQPPCCHGCSPRLLLPWFQTSPQLPWLSTPPTVAIATQQLSRYPDPNKLRRPSDTLLQQSGTVHVTWLLLSDDINQILSLLLVRNWNWCLSFMSAREAKLAASKRQCLNQTLYCWTMTIRLVVSVY